MGHRPDLDRALLNPAAVFTSPAEVVNDSGLSTDEKREVLRRWGSSIANATRPLFICSHQLQP